MIEPLIAVDLGSRPAAGLITGTEQCPVLLDVRRFSRWESRLFVAVLEAWRLEWPRAEVWCEQTFSHRGRKRRYLRDVGRVQEGQAGFLSGMLGRDVLRVPPCSDAEARVAWAVFGRPEQGEGTAGEHVRDMLAVALKALIRRHDAAKVAARSE